jgi:Rrf2 family protein
MISKSGTQALQAMAVLGALEPGEYLGAAEIASRIHAASNYLSKLLQQLARAGILEGRKGGKGGFRLARRAETITLFEVLEPIDRVSRICSCMLGQAQCSHREPCKLHLGWSKVRDQYLGFLKTTSLAAVGH